MVPEKRQHNNGWFGPPRRVLQFRTPVSCLISVAPKEKEQLECWKTIIVEERAFGEPANWKGKPKQALGVMHSTSLLSGGRAGGAYGFAFGGGGIRQPASSMASNPTVWVGLTFSIGPINSSPQTGWIVLKTSVLKSRAKVFFETKLHHCSGSKEQKKTPRKEQVGGQTPPRIRLQAPR